MYGSSLRMETRWPRALRMRPTDAVTMPLPTELTTPPVTKMYFVMSALPRGGERGHDQWSWTERPFVKRVLRDAVDPVRNARPSHARGRNASLRAVRNVSTGFMDEHAHRVAYDRPSRGYGMIRRRQ